jgi:glycosyltransferase involved in cell wall biosynthesis
VALAVTVRVLHVTPYFAPAFVYGGPPRSILGLCRGLQHAGAAVAVVTTTANGNTELPHEATKGSAFADVRVDYLRRSFPKRHFGASGLRAWLDDHRGAYDLAHVHGCWNVFGWSAARWCRTAGLPYVISPRGMLHPSSFQKDSIRKSVAYRAIEQRTLRAARFIHATSAEEAAIVSALDTGPPIVMVPNGIDIVDAPSNASTHAFRARQGATASDFVFLFLGRLHPQKGIDRLIAAFREVAAVRAGAQLWLAGTGDAEYVQRLRDMAHEFVPGGRIVFTGFLDGEDRRMALASANAFVLTSLSENFGMGVAEALAAGCPAIVTRECPWRQIEEWRAGFHVDSAPPAIAAAMERLAADPAGARLMGENGRRAVRQALDWNRLAVDMLDAYRSALGAIH